MVCLDIMISYLNSHLSISHADLQHPAGIILKNKLTNVYMVIVIVTAINEFNNHANGKHSCYCVKKTNRFVIKTSD